METETVAAHVTDTAANDWRTTLPEDYRDKYQEFKSPADVIKGYDGLVKKLGANPIVRPADNAPEADKQAYFTRLAREFGVPEKLEEYAVEVPQEFASHVNAERVEKFKAAAHQLGIPPKAFNELMKMDLADGIEAQNKQREAGIAELKAKWGSEYDSKVAAAIGVAKKFYPDIANDSRYGNDPVLVATLADMAAKMGEAGLERPQTGGAAEGGYTRERAQQLLAEANKATTLQEKEAKMAEANKIYQQLFNSK